MDGEIFIILAVLALVHLPFRIRFRQWRTVRRQLKRDRILNLTLARMAAEESERWRAVMADRALNAPQEAQYATR
ncbi:hypothetical protein EON83_20375 [bacterium]|nr:MAG: hypothetical protein EON83_20375 [bacterium]